jgi:flagellar biosynthesis protein FlhG
LIANEDKPVQKAETKKEIRARLPRVVAISSGKGGVGKSSITVNLGISLAKHGAKVCVLDADTGLANANILLGLTPQFSLEHVLYGAKSIEEVMLDGPHGMKIIPGANGISECVTLHPRQQLRLTRELARVENDFDFLLVDTAAGISNTTLDFVSAAQHALIVITPEPTSLTDAFSLIKLLKRRSSKLHYHIMVNMCSGANQAKEVYHRFCSAIEKYIGIESHYLGFILRDESMRAAVVLQNPVAMFPDDDPSCRSFLRLADTLDNATRALTSHSSFSAYWHRQFRRQRNGTDEKPSEENVPPLSQTPEPPTLEQREEDYLSEVRSRVLLLVEQGRVDIESLKKLLQEGIDAFIKRHNTLPIDTLGLVEFLVQSPERNDLLLRDIHERVKCWGGGSPHPTVDELMVDDRKSLLEVDDALSESADKLSESADKLSESVDTLPEPTEQDNLSVDNSAAVDGNQVEQALEFEVVQDESDLEIADSSSELIEGEVERPESRGHKPEPVLTSNDEEPAEGPDTQIEIHIDPDLIKSGLRAHQYDTERFGSQDGLLEILQRHGTTDKPLSDLLGGL